MTRYLCCKHCEDPCPAIGHTKRCEECPYANSKGRKPAEGFHYSAAVVRTWPAEKAHVTARDLQRASDQQDRLDAAAELSRSRAAPRHAASAVPLPRRQRVV